MKNEKGVILNTLVQIQLLDDEHEPVGPWGTGTILYSDDYGELVKFEGEEPQWWGTGTITKPMPSPQDVRYSKMLNLWKGSALSRAWDSDQSMVCLGEVLSFLSRKEELWVPSEGEGG